MSGKRIHLSSPVLMVEEEAKVTEKQGIVSILRSDSEQIKASSLRRTLSADMSSKKWLTQHGFSSSYSPMKKIASSEELALSSLSSTADSSFSSSEEGEEDEEYELRKSKLEKPSQNDIWSLILSQKVKEDDSSKLQPPYVHPLVKKSKSSLNDKSLQICTESLGSETGSEGFSSYPSSESGDGEEDKEEAQVTQPQEEKESRFLFDREESRVIKKYNYYTNKKSPLKSFPPPLPSLPRCEGPSLLMQSHRENGRLVLEAVSVPSQNYFRAHREAGRLLLSFSNRPSEEPTLEETFDQREDEVEEIEEELFQNFEEEEKDNNEAEEDQEDDDDDDEEEEEEGEEMVEKIIEGEEIGIMMEQEPKLSSGVINVHRSALMMKKFMGLDNRNPTWPNKYNKSVNLVEMEMEVEEGSTPTPLAQSLPRPPRVARLIPSPPATATGAASFNAYEYFWRTKPTVATLINPISQQGPVGPVKINKQYEQQEMVLLRGNKADYLVPLMKGCKESRRSLLIWEPYCIATS